MCDSDDLTIAYLYGYHSRDDEVKALKARVAELEGNLTIKEAPDSEGMWWWRQYPTTEWEPRIVQIRQGRFNELDPDNACEGVGYDDYRTAWEPPYAGQWYGPIPEPPKTAGTLTSGSGL